VDRKQTRAFEAFVAESGDSLLRMATLLTSEPDAAEDVYQETLHRLAARWSRVDSPRAFCRRVMHNIVIDRARAQQRRPRELGLFATHDSSDPRSGDPAVAVELRPTLLAALGTLTAQQRVIVVLRYFDDPQRSRSRGPAQHLARNGQEHRITRRGSVAGPARAHRPVRHHRLHRHRDLRGQPCL
jgi:RNA polymerase sigma factor (sigma-70 family)